MKWTCLTLLILLAGCAEKKMETGSKNQLSKSELKNKIKGGWAGQTIGVTFGGPYEFRFNGSFIQDYQPLEWNDSAIRYNMLQNAGLYDDVYMDLTFVDVFEKLGLNAPVDSFANAYANAGYMLWHANQAGRYNILQGIKPPLSGHWLNNPHADDIDYQIESDFAGLMSPGMPNTAASISDRIGHIMNYGDGWYGGVFVSSMYSLAFVENNLSTIVEEALKTIPVESSFHQCISDVIQWHRKYPQDWHQTWFEIQKKWSSETGCPDGVFNAFNIDAKINAAYVVLGLLYGEGDFKKTLEIATRAGQDADCNPSTAGGILGTVIGYDRIPEYWKKGLKTAESIDFKYTTMSLDKTYEISYKHAIANLTQNGGKEEGDLVLLPIQKPQPVKLEKSFEKLTPVNKTRWYNALNDSNNYRFQFEGTAFVLRGEARKKNDTHNEGVLDLKVTIDGGQPKRIPLPTNFTTRSQELCWNYQLSAGKHEVIIQWVNPDPRYELRTYDILVYQNQ